MRSAFDVEHGEIAKYSAAYGANRYVVDELKQEKLKRLKKMKKKPGLSFGKAFGGSILGQALKVDRGVGAGQMTARNLGGGRAMKGNYVPARANAKRAGRKAAKQFRQLGTPKGYGGYASAHPGVESANTGWVSRGASHTALGPGKAAPAGMRGPIQSRVKTSAMKANERKFL
jgi:hypothetical protein